MPISPIVQQSHLERNRSTRDPCRHAQIADAESTPSVSQVTATSHGCRSQSELVNDLTGAGTDAVAAESTVRKDGLTSAQFKVESRRQRVARIGKLLSRAPGCGPSSRWSSGGGELPNLELNHEEHGGREGGRSAIPSGLQGFAQGPSACRGPVYIFSL